MSKATVVGLGEAGALYARGLAEAGFDVAGHDPRIASTDRAITQHASLRDAVAGADLVLSLVGAAAARDVASAALACMPTTAILADLNTGSPALKREIGDDAARLGIDVVDVAVLAPVPRAGARTPLMVSGPGSERFVDLMAPTGAAIEDLGGEAGDAAARKLVRSAFMKGLAGVVLESVGAARAAGFEPWLRAQIAEELGGDGAALVERLLEGSRQHAARRVHEVHDASEFLRLLGEPSWSTDAAGRWLERLRDDEPEPQRA